METERQVKRKRTARGLHTVSQPSGHTLKLIVQCLQPSDILHCIQTCREWKNEIDEEVWAAVAKNTHPAAVAAIEASNAELDYRSMALGLSQPFCIIEQHGPADQEYPRPQLLLEDILVVIEIRETPTKKVLGWCMVKCLN